MSKKIKLAEDTIDQKELKLLADWILRGNQLTKGKLTIEFEEKFSNFIGSKYSIFVNSGSSANLLMIYSLIQSKRLRNSKVIAPAVSWVTTISPLMQLGLETHLCDCNLENLGLDINHLEKLCKEHRPSLLITCDVLGHANDYKEITRICEKYDVIILEDSCEALGSEYYGSKLGTIGIAGSYSFYYGHHMSTIEGGMVITDDKDLYNIMKSIRSHGWSRDLETDEAETLRDQFKIDEFRNYYTFYYPGFNLRSSDLNAFLGILQLEKINEIVNKRMINFRYYKELLPDFWSQESETEIISSFAYGTIVDNRLKLANFLSANLIESRPLICGNIARHPFWNGEREGLKNADLIHEKGIYLPNHLNIDSKDIEKITDLIKTFYKRSF